MIKNITQLFDKAKRELSRLGLTLFYFYFLLWLLGIIGVMSSGVLIVLKGLAVTSTLNSTWWQLISLLVVSVLMTKLFSRELFTLVGIEREVKLINPLPKVSNVVPFDSKKNWK